MAISNKIITFGFVLIGVLLLLNNNAISLWDQDEAAYAGFGLNFLESEQWLIPEFPWSNMHRKTPLHFWNIALSYKLFGINHFAVRISSSVAIFLTCLLTYVMGKRVVNDKSTAFLASLILGSSFLVVLLGKVAITDATLLLLSTVCAFSIIEVLRNKTFLFVVIFWTAFALALLTKGPPIIIFSGGFVGLLVILHPNRKNLIALHPWIFLPLAAAPLFYWGYQATLIDGGEFVDWLVDWYILKRVSGSVLGQTGPPGYYVVTFIGSFLPYLMFFPSAIKEVVVEIKRKEEQAIILVCWLIGGWLFYELSPSKLPAYAIAAHVPIAMLIAKKIINHYKSSGPVKKSLYRTHIIINSIIVSAIIVGFFVVGISGKSLILLILSTSVLLVCLFFMNKVFKLNDTKKLIQLTFIFAFLLQFLAWGAIIPSIDFLKDSTRRVASYITNNVIPETTIVIANKKGNPPSLPYYLRLNFEHAFIDAGSEKLYGKFNSTKPHALILDEKDKNYFLNKDSTLVFQEISSYMPDRKAISKYFVIYNNFAKKSN